MAAHPKFARHMGEWQFDYFLAQKHYPIDTIPVTPPELVPRRISM